MSRVAYPVVMTTGIGLFYLFGALGWSSTIAAYTAIAVGALGIATIEVWHPYRQSWHIKPVEAANDLAFLVLIQILLPTMLSLAAVNALEAGVSRQDWSINSLWPQHLPIAIQALLMLIGGDALRYWLHRASHHWTLLWRFHAVHHSPHRLNWLNTSRFHPFDKTAQFFGDSLPFIVFGVNSDVLSLYFVFYALNGFFQHSNCNVQLGWLNYVIAGPELHRWHHSVVITESNQNFGNNLIIWDWIFGTRFLPSNRVVGKLGLINRDYPSGFAAQLSTPFRGRLDQNSS